MRTVLAAFILTLFGSAADGANPYNPWQFDANLPALGLHGYANAWTLDPAYICNDATCTQAVRLGRNTGAERSFAYSADFGIWDGPAGEFWTDAHGQQVVAAGTPGAVRQYLAPGADLRPRPLAGATCNGAGLPPFYHCGALRDAPATPLWMAGPN
jgi:hypothetical protein